MPNFDLNYNSNDYSLVATGSTSTTFGPEPGDYIRLSVLNQNNRRPVIISDFGEAIFYATPNTDSLILQTPSRVDDVLDVTIGGAGGEFNDFQIYQDSTTAASIYIKPNEILSSSLVPEGNYVIQTDFLNQYQPTNNDRFIVKQISTSRKEVRLKLLDSDITKGDDTIESFKTALGDNTSDANGYNFKHVLSIGRGINVPIVNYIFDNVTDGEDNQSIILRLYEPLPTNVNTRTLVTIEKEVLITQTEDVYYFSDIPPAFPGGHLNKDSFFDYGSSFNSDEGFQTYNELSSSISTEVLQSLYSGSSFDYPNLNTDFTNFNNHTFFGSAKQKLENFKTKIEKIQSYYTDISSSLSISGDSMESSSNYLISYRQNLFDKIQKEKSTFTPYERFLYYDGQNQNSASAPGVGNNYADIVPVADIHNSPTTILENTDGFDFVYKHSNEVTNVGKPVALFRFKYKAHEKPFFNYSGSVYLSFLMKGDNAINTQFQTYNNLASQNEGKRPFDALYKNEVLVPSTTGSEWRKFIFEASQSYWIPTENAPIPHDVGSVDDFTEGSNQVEVLHGTIKTGSNQIKDSSGHYSDLTTVVTQSGVPFYGSVMPGGDLFNIYYSSGSSPDDCSNTHPSDTLFTGWEMIPDEPTDEPALSYLTATVRSNYIQNERHSYFTGDGNFEPFHPTLGTPVLSFEGNTEDDSVSAYFHSYGAGLSINVLGADGNFVTASGEGAGWIPSGTTYVVTGYFKTEDPTGWRMYPYVGHNDTGTTIIGSSQAVYPEDGWKKLTWYQTTSVEREGYLNFWSAGHNDGGTATELQGRSYVTAVRLEHGDTASDFGPPCNAVTSSFITDVKVSLNDPSNTLPFDVISNNTSTEFTEWYNDLYSSAETFDTYNIHNLENNLPSYIKNSSEYGDFKKFLSLIGEHFDLIRNHIDGLTTLHNRSYDKIDSVPGNLLPILLDNMGWDSINPFTGSLSGYFGQFLSSVTSEKDLAEATWRKSLNNLIYLYKTKGTQNSIRTLLNIYGYPADVLEIREFGGSTEPQNDHPISPNLPELGTTNRDTNLRDATGNVSFIQKRVRLPNYKFNNDSDRILNLNWWMNDAKPNTIEFVYKHTKSKNTQEILISSGSGAASSDATITILSSSAANLDGGGIMITSSDGTGKTYIFDDDSDGATGTVDANGRIRVQINGMSDVAKYVTELSKSIASSNGHNGKIKIVDEQYLSASNSSFGTNTSQSFALADSGKLNLFQVTSGIEGDNTITSSVSGSFITTTGFANGNDDERLWDLRLIPSNEQHLSSSFEFRLNNSQYASGSIESNAISMSTPYVNMHDGELWNVMLQRMTSSIGGQGTQEYRLFTTLQKKNIISKMNFVSMSVSGGITRDKNYNANENWQSYGTRNELSSSNLLVGKTVTGSLAEIRSWTSALSTSKFRLHTLNKLSTTGNTLSSYRDDLIYHFKLNENHTSASAAQSDSTTIDIIDSNPFNIKDYSFTMSSNITTGSLLYGVDTIDIYYIGLQDSSRNIENSRKTIVDRKINFTKNNLNPFHSSIIKSNDIRTQRAKRVNSTKLEIGRSPQDYLNKFILDKVQGFNLEQLYANPRDEYKYNYSELDDFRKEFFDNFDTSIDINKFIRANEKIYNESLIESIKKVVPVRSSLSDRDAPVGITIKPTLLEKQRHNHKKHSTEVDPNTGSDTIEITKRDNYKSGFNLIETYEKDKDIEINVNVIESSTYEKSKDSEINMDDIVVESATYEKDKDIEIDVNVIESITYEKSKDTEIDVDIIESMTYEKTKDSEISIENEIEKSLTYEETKDSEIDIEKVVIETMDYTTTKNATIPQPPTIETTKELDITGSNTYFRDNNTKTFRNLHDEWGRGDGDTHFINNNVTSSATEPTKARTKFQFGSRPPLSSSITLISTDGTKRKYVSGLQTDTNGAISVDGSSILFASSSLGGGGAPVSEAAGNFLAAVTSSNGHGVKFEVSRSTTVVEISQSVGGVTGNEIITFSNDASSSLTGLISGSLPTFVSGSDYIPGDNNVLHIEPRYVFYASGDVEVYSGSVGNTTDFSNQSRFYNRQQLTEGTYGDVEYTSYINGNLGLQKGVAMGKTRYFYTSSIGDIIYPSNHVTRYSNPFKDSMYKGTQNSNPGFQQIFSDDYEDLGTGSFYRVKVTGGENEIIVKGGSNLGRQNTDSDDKIIY